MASSRFKWTESSRSAIPDKTASASSEQPMSVDDVAAMFKVAMSSNDFVLEYKMDDMGMASRKAAAMRVFTQREEALSSVSVMSRGKTVYVCLNTED